MVQVLIKFASAQDIFSALITITKLPESACGAKDGNSRSKLATAYGKTAEDHVSSVYDITTHVRSAGLGENDTIATFSFLLCSRRSAQHTYIPLLRCTIAVNPESPYAVEALKDPEENTTIVYDNAVGRLTQTGVYVYPGPAY